MCNCIWRRMLARLTVVIVSQHIQISNHYVCTSDTDSMLHVNYTSVFKDNVTVCYIWMESNRTVYEEYERGLDMWVTLRWKGICVQFCSICVVFFFNLRFKVDPSLHSIGPYQTCIYFHSCPFDFPAPIRPDIGKAQPVTDIWSTTAPFYK